VPGWHCQRQSALYCTGQCSPVQYSTVQAPFLYPKYLWDFRVKGVASANNSGHCTVLDCTLLHCTALYYALHSYVLHGTVLYCTVLCCGSAVTSCGWGVLNINVNGHKYGLA